MALMLTLGLISCLLLAPLYVVYKPPTVLIHYFQRKWPDVLWHVPTTKKIVALTIDDGPSQYTQAILETLKANNATATFFTIGSHVDGREETLKSIILGHNELGNHAMRDEPSRSLIGGQLAEQINIVEQKIDNAYNAIGKAPPARYFRPGSGFFSTKMREELKRLHYRLILGDIYPHDPQIPYWRVNAAHILSMVKPGGIIICHDGRSWTVPMLQKVLPILKRQGYQVVTLTELLKEE